MEERLYKAAIEGNVESLQSLVREDALILHRNDTTDTFLETPLHVAAMLGHEQFAGELLKLRPDLVAEQDSKGSSPLHLASAKGNLAIVKACLQVSQDVCCLCNRDGKNPVHVAAMRGRVNVLGELLRVKPDAGRAIVERESRSILHLCVECGQLEALQFLIRSGMFEDMVNLKDKNGNTILHLAVAHRQTETTDYLLSVAAIDVNALNHNGITPMDVSMQRGRDIRDLEIEESLIRSRAMITRENNFIPGTGLYSIERDSSRVPRRYKAPKPIKQKDDWLERKKSSLMVVASLIATMAFQVGVTRPQESESDPNTLNQQGSIITTYSNVLYVYLKNYTRFYVVNTTSFIASLSIILLLMSGLPIKNKLFMWILLVITWVAITAIALSYTISVIITAPQGEERSIDRVIGTTMLVWLGLMILILVSHTLRLTWLIFVGLIRLIWKMFCCLIRPFTPRRRVFVSRGNV